MSAPVKPPPTTLESLQQQQLQYAKLTSQLIGNEQLWERARAKKSSTRWFLFFMGVLFFAISKYVMLRTEFAAVFQIYQSGRDAGYACLASNDATAWNLVLNVAYPWLGKYVEQPLSQNQAQFLWDAIRENFIPTQKQIDDSKTPAGQACSGLKFTPMHFLCGDILGPWAVKIGQSPAGALAAIQKNPCASPLGFYLTCNSKILDNADNGLFTLATQGFWGIAKWTGPVGPRDMYSYIFAQTPPPAGCNTGSQIASVSGSMATFSMAGSAFGGEGAAIGAVVGLGLGLFTPTSGCGKSVCSIM